MTELDEDMARALGDRDMELLIGGPALRFVFQQLFDDVILVVEERHLVLEAVRRRCGRSGALQKALESLIAGTDYEPEEILVVPNDVLPAELRSQAAIAVPSQSGFIDRSLWRRPDCSSFARCLNPGNVLIINADSLEMARFVDLAHKEPEWAAVAVLESLFAIGDDRLWSRAVQSRSEREVGGCGILT